MVIITFTSTRTGSNWQQEFETRNWGEIVGHIKNDVSGMSAKLVRAGGQKFNMTLSDDSVLPQVVGGYIISFTQERMKGATENDVFDFTADDIDEMSYRELNLTLKTIREWAATNDKAIFDVIGNYTNITNFERRDMLYKILEMRNVSEDSAEVSSVEVEKLREELQTLQEAFVGLGNRLDTVERALSLKV